MANIHNTMSSSTRVMLKSTPVQIPAVIQGEILPLTETSCGKIIKVSMFQMYVQQIPCVKTGKTT